LYYYAAQQHPEAPKQIDQARHSPVPAAPAAPAPRGPVIKEIPNN